MRRKQPDKKTRHQAHRREHAQTDGEQAQSSPLKNGLLKARQSGCLRSFLIEIDLHTTPVFTLANVTFRYDITQRVKFPYIFALSKNARPVASLKP